MPELKTISNAKILIVEDGNLETRNLQGSLESLGYRVVGSASSEEEAVEKAAKLQPDLIVTDILLPEKMEGVKVTARMRDRFAVPVVYLAAHTGGKTLQRVKVTEPFGYILKPFDKRELGLTVEMALYKHKMERKLKESGHWLATTLKSIGDAVIATGRDGLVTFMNPVAEALTGWKMEDALGKNLGEVFNIIEQETRRPIESPAIRTIREGVIVVLANPSILITKNGSEVPIDDCAAPIKDEGGNVIGCVLVFRDITERKQAEERLAEYTTELTRSNIDLEQFASVASHDLQEPLRMVTLYTQLLAKRYQGKLDAEADEFIGYAVDGAKRMFQLINDLLAYSRLSSRGKEFELTDCEAILKLAVTNLQAAIQEDSAVVTHDPLPTVTANSVQLGQVFQNLIGNALKFHREASPRIHVSAKPKGKEWVFTVEDNGIGIEPQCTERIFAIFQRLHSHQEYSGTGIGLAICKKIVEGHGGRIWVESEPGQGATFYFTLPSQRRRNDRRREDQKAEPSAEIQKGALHPRGRSALCETGISHRCDQRLAH